MSRTDVSGTHADEREFNRMFKVIGHCSGKTLHQLRAWQLEFSEHQDVSYAQVAGMQIMSAFLKEFGIKKKLSGTGLFYFVLKQALNEARKLQYILNPVGGKSHSTEYNNNYGEMKPSPSMWQHTQGLLRRHVGEARITLQEIIEERSRS